MSSRTTKTLSLLVCFAGAISAQNQFSRGRFVWWPEGSTIRRLRGAPGPVVPGGGQSGNNSGSGVAEEAVYRKQATARCVTWTAGLARNNLREPRVSTLCSHTIGFGPQNQVSIRKIFSQSRSEKEANRLPEKPEGFLARRRGSGCILYPEREGQTHYCLQTRQGGSHCNLGRGGLLSRRLPGRPTSAHVNRHDNLRVLNRTAR
jgi:hypothetical protein